ncbi:hypothetical protein VOLCADRAFT_117381 [Volvox carteri f. nagariensis]|uniref:Uncharacterized protein n=1 Tax=Volvox carteri f. nagariensis TaxID=3068 RepID=D8TTT2_VOLCA|nr:uncharacterized protein VOLCADRAFT_117381 [Volvox carteri f. nagariensis]EFJ48918.1 hypothetical protein VOLCADRAFT_117381 [Volvox carteri f. nagariensis]|eukprot:XP_002949815.1 hypothetical protein VOLCADRAFT_117381 [Volvox carteri f. nagariensis]
MAEASDSVAPLAAAAAKPRSKGQRTAVPAYPERVQAVLHYLEANPMRLQSIPMPATAAAAAEHYARVVAGLLYVACGGLDQAHNLVTPLCWGSPTPYGGPPVPGSPAAQDAAYVHALVHRAEGLHDGEFGTGFSNANYSMRRHAAGDEHLEKLAASHGDTFSPAKWVAVCSQAAAAGAGRQLGQSGVSWRHHNPQQPQKQPATAAWCEDVMAEEWRALLEHCYSQLRAAAAAAPSQQGGVDGKKGFSTAC